MTLIQSPASGQQPENYPEVGKECPDVGLRNIHGYTTSHAKISDFRGKWLVLYFWSRYCTTSLEHLAQIDTLSRKFEEQVQFFLAGYEDSNARKIESIYRKEYHMQVPSMFDENLMDAFGTVAFPHVIIVDPKGIVKAVSLEVTEKAITAFIKGQEPFLYHALNKAEKEKMNQSYDSSKGFLQNGNGGSDSSFVYRSVLSYWNRSLPIRGVHRFSHGRKSNEVFVSGSDLARLYQVAYGPFKYIIPAQENAYGDWWYRPILEVKDTSVFGWDYAENPKRYVYSLTVPKDKNQLEHMQQMMQHDLYSYFGYHVSVETRMMPYWKLTASDEAKQRLKTSGGTSEKSRAEIIHIKYTNEPVARLIGLLWSYNQEGPPFVDATGITGNIDITLDGIFTDLGKTREMLGQHGLSLTLAKKKMNVIVIRDH